MGTRRSIPPARRGMTFIEVVLASAMLAIIAGAMFGAYGFAIAAEARDQQTLAAAELANRLILNFLDSPSGMPDQTKVIEYGPLRFRWQYAEERVRVVEAQGDQRDRNKGTPLSNNRFKQVTVTVWLSEQSGGSRFLDPTLPQSTLSRIFDPIYPRNPDSFMKMVSGKGEDFNRLVEMFMLEPGTGTGGTTTAFQRGGGGSAREALGRGRMRQPKLGGGP